MNNLLTRFNKNHSFDVERSISALFILLFMHSHQAWGAGPSDLNSAHALSGPVAVCQESPDLHFRIGSRILRVKSKDWIVIPNPVLTADQKKRPPLKFMACESAPLNVATLELRGPKEREPMLQRNLKLIAPQLNMGLMSGMRHEFKSIESTCQRQAHWTICGTSTDMQLAAQSTDGMNSYVSVKFDIDFYRTPTGTPLFIADSRLGPPLFVGFRAVFYRWDNDLSVAYVPRECLGTQTVKNCATANYIESDQDIQKLIRSLMLSNQ